MPDINVHDDLVRPLTEDGIKSSLKVSDFLKDKKITKAYCSPYKRSIDTILDFTIKNSLEISIIDDLRERKISNYWLEDFHSYARNQWDDFHFKLSEGESLKEVQDRNVQALHSILEKHPHENIVIGTHGTALGTIINHYDKSFDYNSFLRIIDLMPFIVYMEFEGLNLISIEEIIL
jgi:2,3-bisphosphoglycerate-dependent phosphoglycerate mutase